MNNLKESIRRHLLMLSEDTSKLKALSSSGGRSKGIVSGDLLLVGKVGDNYVGEWKSKDFSRTLPAEFKFFKRRKGGEFEEIVYSTVTPDGVTLRFDVNKSKGTVFFELQPNYVDEYRSSDWFLI